MFHAKNHKQLHIFDPWSHMGPKRRKTLDNSWSGLFREKILATLPVESLRENYHDLFGRRTKELYSMIGLMILQQMHNLTDDEAVSQFCFNIEWHYALDITSPDDAYSYVSTKSLWTMRDILSRSGLYHELFDSTTELLIKEFQVEVEKQRIDSVHIESNMRHLGRIGIFVKTIKKFLSNLKRQHRSLFDQLDTELTRRYLSKKEASLFAMVKPSASSKTLDQLAQDLYDLTERFVGIELVNNMSTFKLLTRLFKDQCLVEDDVNSSVKKVAAKPNKDISSDSLQNPSDPDAGFSGHKGKGYQVQVVENYSDKENSLRLITHVAVESADQHDANALVPALEDLHKRGIAPDVMLGDSLYGSDANCEQALQDYGTVVIAPVMRGNQKKLSLSDFVFNNQGHIIACPHGLCPDFVKETRKGYSAGFCRTTCLNCDHFKRCPVKAGKTHCYYRYKEKDIRLARRRQDEDSPAFAESYRFRAGVEATMSEYDRRTGVKHLRVRGMKAVRFAAVMKAIGLNILRASRFRKRKNGNQAPRRGTIPAFLTIYGLIKEQIERRTLMFATITEKYSLNY